MVATSVVAGMSHGAALLLGVARTRVRGREFATFAASPTGLSTRVRHGDHVVVVADRSRVVFWHDLRFLPFQKRCYETRTHSPRDGPTRVRDCRLVNPSQALESPRVSAVVI